jgi:hypothetical protein
MGSALALGCAVALSLLVLGIASRRAAPTSRLRTPPARQALPWIVAGMAVVGGTALVIPGMPAVVVVGLTAYAGVAILVAWRMVSLDRASRWMPPEQRRGRLVVTVIGLTWLGVVLGLLLRIADLVAGALDQP